MQRYFRFIILVQQKKVAVPVNNHFCLQALAADKDFFQTPIDFLCHRDKAASAFGFGFLNIILSAPFPDKLMIYTDFPAFKVKITFCQATKLADTHSCSQQDNKLIIILAVSFILPNKSHPKFLLFFSHGNPFL